MTDGRLMIYKDTKHFNEPSGYQVHTTFEDAEKRFSFKVGTVEVSKVKIEKK